MESRHNKLLLQSYFQFRFGGRHLESAVYGVGRRRQLHIQVGRGRKCGGSRWNYVCLLPQTQVTSTSRKSSIFPWFSSSLQVLGRAMFTQKASKHPELDPLGTGFDRILKFARVAKLFEKNIGGVQICTPPLRPAVRELRPFTMHENASSSIQNTPEPPYGREGSRTTPSRTHHWSSVA